MIKRNFLKHFLYYLSIITIPIITIFLIFLGLMAYEKQRSIEAESAKSAQALRDNYSLVLDSAGMQYDILVRNPRLSIALRNYISHKQISYLDVALTNSIFSNFAALTGNTPYIASVYYYLDNYDSIISSDTGGIMNLSQFSDRSWMDSYHQSTENEWLERREMVLYPYTKPVPVLTYYKKLSMFRGVIMVNIYEDQLKQLLGSSSTLDQFYIIDADGNFLIESNDDAGTLRTEDQHALINAIHSTPDTPFEGWIPFNHSKYYVRIIPADFNTYIAVCTSRSNYYQSLYVLLLQLFIVLAVMICTVFWIAYAITRKNFKQINYFVTLFSEAERGNYTETRPDFIKDEYDIILNNIVQLFVQQTFLQNKLALKEQQQKLAELAALQLQINPHFLFNTLQTLDFKAVEYTGSPTALNQIIEALSDILKYSLQKTDSMVTVKDEIEYLKKYDSIQRYRYEDKYIMYYDYDSVVENMPIMRLILQPLIENSLYHGIKPLEGSGFIKLKITERDDYLTFTVIDTGVGMEKTEISALYENINNPGHESIGLANVNSRLVMRYGDEAGLKILSKKNMGTCISFRIPLDKMMKKVY